MIHRRFAHFISAVAMFNRRAAAFKRSANLCIGNGIVYCEFEDGKGAHFGNYGFSMTVIWRSVSLSIWVAVRRRLDAGQA
jgi:hypothetical protein